MGKLRHREINWLDRVQGTRVHGLRGDFCGKAWLPRRGNALARLVFWRCEDHKETYSPSLSLQLPVLISTCPELLRTWAVPSRSHEHGPMAREAGSVCQVSTFPSSQLLRSSVETLPTPTPWQWDVTIGAGWSLPLGTEFKVCNTNLCPCGMTGQPDPK